MSYYSDQTTIRDSAPPNNPRAAGGARLRGGAAEYDENARCGAHWRRGYDPAW
jgi:hypothetical protein